jgi:hypothetical protein
MIEFRVSMVLLASAFLGLGCSSVQIQGRVVNCASHAPVAEASVKVVEAPRDASAAQTTLNYYRGATARDGTFAVRVASSEPAPWQAQVQKAGFHDAAVRYEIGVRRQDFCLNPR